jgi:predicted DNA-binding transcriptional regulator AlpA
MANAHNALETLLNEHQVAELLNVSVSTIRRRRLLKQPPEPVKIGSSVRYTRVSIQGLIEIGQRSKAEAR